MNPIKKAKSYIQRIVRFKEDYKRMVACVNQLTQNTEAQSHTIGMLQSQIEELAGKIGTIQDQNEKERWERFWRFYSEWWSWGATPAMLQEFKYIERFDVFWENELHDLWLIYICCLLEVEEKPLAISVLKKYADRFGTENVERYLPAANLYTQIFPDCPESILNARKAYEVFQKRQEEQVFENYIRKSHSIAIVGNSDREVGKGQGEGIDAHDVVIRFNDYTGKPPVDYGNKVTVWVRNGSTNCPDMITVRPCEFVIWSDDYLHTYVQGNLLDLMYRDVTDKAYTATMIPSESHKHLREAANLLNPTPGAYMIYYLYEILGSFDKVDFYGFSFADNTFSETDCHATELLNWHEMTTEVPFMKKLINKSC